MPEHSRAAPNLQARAREKPRIMSMTREAQSIYQGDAHVSILLRTNTRRFPSTWRLLTSSSTNWLRHPAGSRTSRTRKTTSDSSMTLFCTGCNASHSCSFVLVVADVDSDGAGTRSLADADVASSSSSHYNSTSCLGCRFTNVLVT
jgi:hypothetical protein